MYARFVLVGAAAFALAGAALGFVWVTTEIPFVMGLQWAAGAGALGAVAGGTRLAVREAIAAGLTYLVAFVALLFVALSLFEFPVPVALAAGITGAVAGAVLAGGGGAMRVGVAALLGFAAGELAMGALSALQPASAGMPGPVQYAWFAAGQALLGLIGGAALGAGFAWTLSPGAGRPARSAA